MRLILPWVIMIDQAILIFIKIKFNYYHFPRTDSSQSIKDALSSGISPFKYLLLPLYVTDCHYLEYCNLCIRKCDKNVRLPSFVISIQEWCPISMVSLWIASLFVVYCIVCCASLLYNHFLVNMNKENSITK